MKTHELKCEERFFYDILRGEKRFEVRRNDRDYQVGDALLLKACDFNGNDTKEVRKLLCRVVYMLRHEACPNGVPHEFVVLGLAQTVTVVGPSGLPIDRRPDDKAPNEEDGWTKL